LHNSAQSSLKSKSFSAEDLLVSLNSIPEVSDYYVAYSGGLDSHVLLHALKKISSSLSGSIYALHVNHGISEHAKDWVHHCETTCQNLGVNFKALEIKEACPKGESLEAWAREKRYQLMTEQLDIEGLLLTAHHLEDQAETLLIQLARGAGVRGLAAMPVLRKHNNVRLARPLLNVNRGKLLKYAELHKLQWIEDDSNYDVSIDRNFFRHQIIPKLRKRWSGIANTLHRVALHQASAANLLDDLAKIDWRFCQTQSSRTLQVDKLLSLSIERQSNLIRYWLRQLDLRVPDSKIMHEILNKFLSAKQESEPLVRWPGAEVRRYQNQMYALKPVLEHDIEVVIDWDMQSACRLSGGVLRANLTHGKGIATDVCADAQLQIRFRKGGEKIQLSNKDHRQELKKLFQEENIPPWERDRLPLLYRDDQLIAVANLWVDISACSEDDKPAWNLEWEKNETQIALDEDERND
jgi:tRNA(Ile)-lysidine synthase